MDQARDLLGLAGGGNKTRRLEFVFAEALATGADTLVTGGAPQSNHCRLTLAVAALVDRHSGKNRIAALNNP